jgi:hypothetical protein
MTSAIVMAVPAIGRGRVMLLMAGLSREMNRP